MRARALSCQTPSSWWTRAVARTGWLPHRARDARVRAPTIACCPIPGRPWWRSVLATGLACVAEHERPAARLDRDPGRELGRGDRPAIRALPARDLDRQLAERQWQGRARRAAVGADQRDRALGVAREHQRVVADRQGLVRAVSPLGAR